MSFGQRKYDGPFVADPGERRIVQYNKSGTIVAQYVSPAWLIRAFTVDPRRNNSTF